MAFAIVFAFLCSGLNGETWHFQICGSRREVAQRLAPLHYEVTEVCGIWNLTRFVFVSFACSYKHTAFLRNHNILRLVSASFTRHECIFYTPTPTLCSERGGTALG